MFTRTGLWNFFTIYGVFLMYVRKLDTVSLSLDGGKLSLLKGGSRSSWWVAVVLAVGGGNCSGWWVAVVLADGWQLFRQWEGTAVLVVGWQLSIVSADGAKAHSCPGWGTAVLAAILADRGQLFWLREGGSYSVCGGGGGQIFRKADAPSDLAPNPCTAMSLHHNSLLL